VSAGEREAPKAASPKSPSQPRKQLALYGRHGDTVKAVEDAKENRVVVYYRDIDGKRHRLLYPRTPQGRAEAKAFAAGWHDERQRLRGGETTLDADALTMQELWQTYTDATFRQLRPATQVSYSQHWSRWMKFIGASTPVAAVTKADCRKYVVFLTADDRSMNQAKLAWSVVQLVHRWAIDEELIETSATVRGRSRFAKDVPALEPDEYSEAEFERLLPQLNYRDALQWRAWVFLMLAGSHGQRANAVLHLRWADIDFEAGTVTWPARYQKQRKPLQQKLPWESIAALRTAKAWREHAMNRRQRRHHKSPKVGAEYLAASDFVLFAERDKSKPMSYSSLHYHLMAAERRAGIAHAPYRAAHGLRRMVVGTIGEGSGDLMLGLEYVGDRDPKMLAAYDRRRQRRVDAAADKLESVRKVSGNKNAAPTEGGEVKPE